MSSAMIGLILVLTGLLLARVAVYLNPVAQPGMQPEQIWYSMGGMLKTMVLLGFCFFVYGLWSIGKGLITRSSNER
jgi:hypothetical protein